MTLKQILRNMADEQAGGHDYVFVLLFGDDHGSEYIGIALDNGQIEILADDEGNTFKPPSHEEGARVVGELNSESLLSQHRRREIYKICGFGKTQ